MSVERKRKSKQVNWNERARGLGLAVEGVEKIRAKIVEPSNVLGVYHGKFVEREEFDKYFENADEIFRFFDTEVVLGAILDASNKEVYFITVSEASQFEDQFTRLTVWRARIE